MPDHLEPVPEEPSEEDLARWGEEVTRLDEEYAPIRRPAWWRWIAIAVVVAMVVATPVAYLWSILTR